MEKARRNGIGHVLPALRIFRFPAADPAFAQLVGDPICEGTERDLEALFCRVYHSNFPAQIGPIPRSIDSASSSLRLQTPQRPTSFP